MMSLQFSIYNNFCFGIKKEYDDQQPILSICKLCTRISNNATYLDKRKILAYELIKFSIKGFNVSCMVFITANWAKYTIQVLVKLPLWQFEFRVQLQGVGKTVTS